MVAWLYRFDRWRYGKPGPAADDGATGRGECNNITIVGNADCWPTSGHNEMQQLRSRMRALNTLRTAARKCATVPLGVLVAVALVFAASAQAPSTTEAPAAQAPAASSAPAAAPASPAASMPAAAPSAPVFNALLPRDLSPWGMFLN